MNFTQLRSRMRPLLDTGISIELISAPGRGKSTFIDDSIDLYSEQDGEEWGLSKLFLATQTPPDLIGYQFKGEREWDGKKVAVTDPTLPGWMVTRTGKPVFAYKRGILFLDEYGQGEADVKRSSAELLLNGQLGPWKLPKGWSVVAASNRSSDRSGVTKSFDFVINRRLEVHISDDLDSWNEWANKNNVSALAIYFAKEHTNVVFNDGVPEKQGPWCTPRSLVMCDRMLRALSKDGETFPDDPEAVELASGIIGAAAAQQFFVAVKLEREMPAYETIVANPKKAKLPDKIDAQYLIAHKLAHKVSEEDITPVIEYVTRMPKELQVTMARASVLRNRKLIATPAMLKWTKENSSLLAAIAL